MMASFPVYFDKHNYKNNDEFIIFFLIIFKNSSNEYFLQL